VKRHPSLVSLSRDHHHALVLARDARRDAGDIAKRFEEELAPHFALEERELVRRCVDYGEPLATLAKRVVADHEALRALVASPSDFGAKLEEHVRFEEREWFPAIEEHLCMPKLPAGVAPYKQTAVFDARTVPDGLRRSHRLKAETWGEIVVEQGRVVYVLEDDDEWSIALRPGLVGVVAPERPHHVEPDDDARFFVRFSK
jgi:tellurite resistance-related uncharacterized protein